MDPEVRELISRVGLAIVEWSAAPGAAAVSSTDSLVEHYSQQARDNRQRPVLELFAPLDPDSTVVLPWSGAHGVKAVALKNGYTGAGLGGFFSPGGLLEWVTKNETVQITPAGRQRFAEIEERLSLAA